MYNLLHMPMSDLQLVFQWWGTLFLVGAVAYPFTKRLFGDWFDRGFFFTKAVGMAMVTYGVYILGILHVAPFTTQTIWAVMGVLFLAGLPLYVRKKETHTWQRALMLGAEELFFFAALLFWSWIKGHEPSIHGLEKFMDFGFTKSILNSAYFPAPDMWYTGLSINYYYFGHTVMAVLTRLSGIDLTYTFNLMLASIFAFTLTMSFSIGVQLLQGVARIGVMGKIAGGMLTAFLATMAGNMQTIYAFTRGYTGDNVVPFWQLVWKMSDIGGVKGMWDGTLWARFAEGMNTYWYANATRFIPYTIHEFPSYSFVVSDVHGHVLSIPFVLLALALLIHKKTSPIFYGFLCGVLLMTNALDGPIYLGLFMIIFWKNWKHIGMAIGAAAVTSLPFLVHFKSFVNGVALNCPPAFLADIQIGPLIFEGVDKCQRSPLWMWWLLWGFFVYCGTWLVVGMVKNKNRMAHELLLAILFFLSLALLIFPEFFYFKDIYPMHFRSNTMFKLGYQAFIMLSIVSGYTIVRFASGKGKKVLFFVFLIPQLFLVSIYPVFSVRSYFNSLRHYEGIFGMGWFQRQYPDDWAGITWLNQNVKCNTQDATCTNPVIVEADGDSYTDYDRFSTFTGLPTVVGWSVHEWLWRGSYDVVSPRKEEVRRIYESEDIEETKDILTKYMVKYVIVGSLEREKFTGLQEGKFSQLGEQVFAHGTTVIYQVH